MKRTLLRRTAMTVAVIALLVTVRMALEPRRTEVPPLRLGPADRARVSNALTASALSRNALYDALASQQILLVGESHFALEPQTFVTDLASQLHARDGRRALLLLELPEPMQKTIDHYLATGDEPALTAEWQRYRKFALPYRPLVRWARAHPEAVSGIVADDERPMRTALMRLLLTDTRNASMADAVTQACRTHPADRIIVFGGRFHMMKGGRYLYDSPTRSPVGARLRRIPGVPRQVASVWLFQGDSPAAGAWSTPGAIALSGAAGALPIRTLQGEAVFRASTLRELVDYAVYLGPATATK